MDETVRGDPLRDLPEWLEEFMENLVNESVLAQRDAPASSSRESASEPRGKVVYCYGKGKFKKILLKHGWEKIPNWECLCVHREKGLFLSVYVDDIKLAGKKQNINPMWKVLNKEVDLGEPTSFLDHVYLGCTQRECRN